MTTITGQSPHSEYFFEFDDLAGEAHFILWHHLRHHTYDLLLSQKGTTLPPLDLTGEVDSDWLHRHATRHRTLRRVLQDIPGNSVIGLRSTNWNARQQRTDWLFIHAQDHMKFDAYFGLP